MCMLGVYCMRGSGRPVGGEPERKGGRGGGLLWGQVWTTANRIKCTRDSGHPAHVRSNLDCADPPIGVGVVLYTVSEKEFDRTTLVKFD